MNNMIRNIVIASLSAIAMLTTTTATAARPDNIANTTWTIQVNRDVEELTITSQGAGGVAGAATCRVINGELGDTLTTPVITIRGWYCPATGRIHFRHLNVGTDNTVRTFTGYISDVADDPLDETLYMSGTMAVEDKAFGDLGEYNFSATK